MGNDALTPVVTSCSAVLFDFDGPICDVFAGLPAPGVAEELTRMVAEHEPALEEEALGTSDPLEVLRISTKGGPLLVKQVEEALTAAEVSAVAVAGDPVDGASDALKASLSLRRPVAVVSNNSVECVQAFLMSHGLLPLVQEVVGRPPRRPDLMKPSPHSLMVAAEALSRDPAQCVLIGDSVTDVEAARAAGAKAIGLANKPLKYESLTHAEASAVITDMRELANVLATGTR